MKSLNRPLVAFIACLGAFASPNSPGIGPLEAQLIRHPEGESIRMQIVPLAARGSHNCPALLVDFAERFSDAGRRVVSELIGRSKASTGNALIGPSGQLKIGFYYPAVQNADGEWMSLEAGMRQIFLREVLKWELARVERRAAAVATEWAKIARGRTTAVQMSNTNEVDENGLGLDPFLQSHRQWFADQNILTGLVTLPPGKQFKQGRELYVQGIGRQIKVTAERMQKTLRSEGNTRIDLAFRSFVERPSFGAYDPAHYEWLFGFYRQFIDELNAIFRITIADEPQEFRSLTTVDYDSLGAPFSLQHGWPVLELPEQNAFIYYDPYLGGIAAQHVDGMLNAALAATLAHGGGAMTSNVASWNNLNPKLRSLGLNGFAADLPGSMGPFGTAMSQLNDPFEIAALLGLWQRSVRISQTAPLAVGRSLGSTQQFASAAIHYLHGQDNYSSQTSLYVLTAFANPDTIDDQITTVREQAADQKREAVPGLTPGGLERAAEFCNRLNAILDDVRARDPKALSQFGDQVFFVQGEADSDGAPRDGKGTVVTALETYRDKYAPFAHIYVVTDPLKERPDLANLFDADLREGSHFLFSTRPNVTAKNVPDALKNTPPHLWPKFSDQTTEMVALMYAGLDYVIDLSPLNDTRTAIMKIMHRDERKRLHGGMPWGYLRAFVAGINVALAKQGYAIDFDRLLTDTVPPGRETLEQRLKRVIVFMQDEAKRARRMLEAIEK